jgi:hypothetical protein
VIGQARALYISPDRSFTATFAGFRRRAAAAAIDWTICAVVYLLASIPAGVVQVLPTAGLRSLLRRRELRRAARRLLRARPDPHPHGNRARLDRAAATVWGLLDARRQPLDMKLFGLVVIEEIVETHPAPSPWSGLWRRAP